MREGKLASSLAICRAPPIGMMSCHVTSFTCNLRPSALLLNEPGMSGNEARSALLWRYSRGLVEGVVASMVVSMCLPKLYY